MMKSVIYVPLEKGIYDIVLNEIKKEMKRICVRFNTELEVKIKKMLLSNIEEQIDFHINSKTKVNFSIKNNTMEFPVYVENYSLNLKEDERKYNWNGKNWEIHKNGITEQEFFKKTREQMISDCKTCALYATESYIY